MPAPRLPRPPFWMIAIAITGVVASWVPLAISARARTNRSSEPRIQLLQDMGVQPKLREQQTSTLFEDGRAMRPAVPGTVAYGALETDDHYYRGFQSVTGADGKPKMVFFKGFPANVQLSDALLKHGQERFNIYCAICHGADGTGHGAVNERALQLSDAGAVGMTWTQAANLHTVRDREEGNLFNTITNGVRNMPGYGNQIPVADRWAIVAYIRALQFSQNAPPSVLTADQAKLLPK